MQWEALFHLHANVESPIEAGQMDVKRNEIIFLAWGMDRQAVDDLGNYFLNNHRDAHFPSSMEGGSAQYPQSQREPGAQKP